MIESNTEVYALKVTRGRLSGYRKLDKYVYPKSMTYKSLEFRDKFFNLKCLETFIVEDFHTQCKRLGAS